MKQNFPQKIHFLFLAIALLLSFSGFVAAQETTGTLVGVVRDSSGAAVAGATVTITDPTKNNTVVRTITTTDEGVFSAPNLNVSTYTITVEAPNFKRRVQTDVKLDVGARRNVDIALEAGNISETVTVEADEVAVNLTTPTASTTISGDQVRELSVNNRNFVQLVTLAPGVSNNLADQVYVGTTNPNGQANTVQISVNGARSSQNTFTVDGADITDRGSNLTIQAYPSIDSIGEFKVLRSLYPAESGRSGGGQVNVVTRSGTDKFHGSFFEFVRNEEFDANSFFNNQRAPFGIDENAKARRSPFRYNNYGLTFSGPVYGFNFGEGGDGGLFRRYEKTFFFFSEEQRKDRRFPTLISSVPDAQLRLGIFPVPICLSATISGTTRTCTNILPAGTPLSSRAAINPVAQSYLTNIYNRIPLPNDPGVAFRLVSPGSGRSDFRQEIIKIDTSLTKNLSAFYRYQRDEIPTVDINSLFSAGSGIPGVSTSETNSPGRAHTLQMNYVVSPNMIVEGRYTYSYGAILSNTTGLLARENSPINVPLPYASGDDRVPHVIGNGFNSLVAFGPYDNFSDKNDFSGSLTYIFGNHTTKYGGSFSKYRKNENALGGSNQGSFSGFLNTTAASPTQGNVCVNPADPTSSVGVICPAGLSSASQLFANFLLGTNVSFLQSKFDLTADFRQRNFEAFAQDEWRVRPNLTLYYGIRYSFFGSPWDRNGFLTNFVPELFNRADAPLVTGAGNRVAGTGNFCNGLIINSQNIPTTLPANCTPTVSPYGKFVVDAKKRNFAPRVGLAFDPFGKGKTSIRTGYGIYHEQTLVGTFLQNLGANPPYQETINVSGTRLDQPIPVGASVGVVSSLAALTVRGQQTDWKTPYMQHWSLDLQQQLTSKTLVTVGYYGSKGTNLIGIVDINLLPPGTASKTQCATGANTTATAGATLVPCKQPGVPFFTAAAELILDQIRPYRGYRAINIIQPRFNSNYHSLQISAQQRFSGDSQAGLAYTWSKNLTDSQTDRSSSPQNPYDLRSEYGRAALDRRHIITGNFSYELPFYKSQEGFIGKILGGFQTQGIVTYQTGLPFTATVAGYDPAGIGFLGPSASGGRPNQIGNPNSGAPNSQEQFFNPAAFQTNFTQTSGVPELPGDASRGSIHGPRTFRLDLTLSKNIRFSESMRLQLRAESFNVLNTTNFSFFGASASSFNANPSLNSFGRVTATRDPRTFQFGVKFYF